MLVPLFLDLDTAAGGLPEVLATIPPQESVAGIALTLDVSGYFSGATSYSVAGTLPLGISFNTTTGVFSGAPTTIADYPGITVTATNGSGSSSAPPFDWLIESAISALPPPLILENSFVQRQAGSVQPLVDLYHEWGSDLVLSASQDLQTVA